MKTLVLNGIPGDAVYEPIEKALEEKLVNHSTNSIEYFRLRDMNINYCTGCWSCWWKTPGKCAIKDDHEQILSRIPHVDEILYISPVIMGYESALMKTCKDRSIPNAHPYIRIYKGEMHHYQRYDDMPVIKVLLLENEDTTKEDINLIEDTYNRMALNFASKVSSFKTIKTTGGDADVVDSI